jgi:hypothetical protein
MVGLERYQVAADGKYGEPVPLPAPFGFEIATGKVAAHRYRLITSAGPGRLVSG